MTRSLPRLRRRASALWLTALLVLVQVFGQVGHSAAHRGAGLSVAHRATVHAVGPTALASHCALCQLAAQERLLPRHAAAAAPPALRATRTDAPPRLFLCPTAPCHQTASRAPPFA